MANEISIAASADQTIYVLLQNPAGKFWNTVDLTQDTYATADRAEYDIALTEQGTSSGIYLADFPSAITTAGTYLYYAYVQSGASPAEGDSLVGTGEIDWTGTFAGVADATGTMSGTEFRDYVLRGGFKRTDKDTELYEAATDAVEELRRRFSFSDAHEDMETTDQISTLGDFKLDVEDDFGMVIDVRIEDDDTATVLTQRSKAQFDALYPDINNTSDKGYPRDFTISEGQIWIGPIPDQTDYDYRVAYSKRGGTITSSTTAVPFTNVYRELLRYMVEERLWKLMDQYDRAQYAAGKAEQMFEQARMREEKNHGGVYFATRYKDC